MSATMVAVSRDVLYKWTNEWMNKLNVIHHNQAK